MEPRQQATGEQFSPIIKYSHSNLARPQPGAQGGLIAGRQLWQELALSLNSIGTGVNNSSDKWKKVWADWKSKTKKKASIIRRHNSDTGGGPNNKFASTALEARLLAISGELAVEGHSQIEEQGFNIPYPMLSARVANEVELVLSPPEVVEPMLPSANRQPTPSALLQPPPPSVSASASISPLSSLTSPSCRGMSPRRRRLCTTPRKRRKQSTTPFERAANEFAAVERRRLKLEEKREKNEAQRIEVERERNILFGRIADIADAMCQQYMQNSKNSQK